MVQSDESNQLLPVNLEWSTRFKRYTFSPMLDAELQKLFCNAEELLQQARIVKNSRSTSAGIFSLNGKEYFIKRSNAVSWMERIRRIGRMSRAARNWMVDARVRSAGIATPTIYAAIDTAPYGLPGTSYLITECFPLPMTAGSKFILPVLIEESGNDQRRLIQRLVKLALKLHANGIEHGDLKLNNVLAVRQSSGEFTLGLFDFDGSVLHRNACSDTVRIRDLARMASSMFIRCCQIGIECDYRTNLLTWAAEYAAAGGPDYTENLQYHRRTAKLLPSGLKYRIEAQ
jgi:tRNA A-37 threonylcarbamoyl transferase component Bud32